MKRSEAIDPRVSRLRGCSAVRRARSLACVVALAAGFCSVLERSGSDAAAQTPVPTPTPKPYPLQVRRLSGLAAPTTSTARQILSEASEILQRDDDLSYDARDVDCRIRFSLRNSTVSRFPNSTDSSLGNSAQRAAKAQDWADGVTAEEAQEIHGLAGDLKVVPSIVTCDTGVGPQILAGILACAEPDPDGWAGPERGSVIVTHGADPYVTANAWLHEIGHVRGLQHRMTGQRNGCASSEVEAGECGGNQLTCPRAVMCPTLALNYRVCHNECGYLLPP